MGSAQRLSLGFGDTCPLGFSLWYAVPLGAMLSGDPLLVAAVYGTYGFVRAAAAPLMLLGSMSFGGNLSGWLVAHHKGGRVLAAGQLILLGTTVPVAVGL